MSSFRRGIAAMEFGDWEEAYHLFRKSIRLCPDNLLFRKTIRGVARKLRDSVRVTGFNCATHSGLIEAAIKAEDWASVDELAEDGLRFLPCDPSFNMALAHAALGQGFRAIAKFACECALRADHNNSEALSFRLKLLDDWPT